MISQQLSLDGNIGLFIQPLYIQSYPTLLIPDNWRCSIYRTSLIIHIWSNRIKPTLWSTLLRSIVYCTSYNILTMYIHCTSYIVRRTIYVLYIIHCTYIVCRILNTSYVVYMICSNGIAFTRIPNFRYWQRKQHITFYTKHRCNTNAYYYFGFY